MKIENIEKICNKNWLIETEDKAIAFSEVSSTKVLDYLSSMFNQPERSKREDFYQKLAKEYLDGKEYWEKNPSEEISIECFASWLDRRCGALNSRETD